MKSFIFAGLVACTVVPCGSAQAQSLPIAPIAAQTDLSPRQQVSLHPFSFLVSTLNVEYERRLSTSWSGLVAPKIGLSKAVTLEGARQLGQSVGLEAGGRWFAAGQALRGFFLQPTLSYTWFYPENTSAHALGLHGKAGYQWTIADRAFIHLAGGVQYGAGWADSDILDEGDVGEGKKRYRLRGFLPDLSFAIGVGF